MNVLRRDGSSIVVSETCHVLCIRGIKSKEYLNSNAIKDFLHIGEDPLTCLTSFDSINALHVVKDEIIKKDPELLISYYESLKPHTYDTQSFIFQDLEIQRIHIPQEECLIDSIPLTFEKQHFGSYCDCDNDEEHSVTVSPIPSLWKEYFPEIISTNNQCTIQRLSSTNHISSHIDSHIFEENIYIVFIENDGVLSLTNNSGVETRIHVSNHSVIHLRGVYRYIYKFGLFSYEGQPLVTFIFRNTRNDGSICECIYPNVCDSRLNATIRLNDKMASKLESTHVHSVYENIAGHFSDTRHKPWPKVMDFLNSCNPYGTLIDVGCGNGKYFGHHPGMLQIGCDYSFGLLQIVKERSFEGVRCDCLKLPFRSNLADAIISIAVIHHLSTWERRRDALAEMIRVLKVGGRVLIYAWAKEQNKNSVSSSYLKKNSLSNPQSCSKNQVKRCDTKFPLVLPVHKNRTNFLHTDLLVPWKKKTKSEDNQGGEEKTFHRYYHMFQEGELEELANSIVDLTLDEIYYEQGNWCIVARKLR
ncbi:tRNA (carboxymethyluridine(34)-5-O)-methyltransferase alkbh8 [Lepeophtheirus salmonis]|uniref:tRNA (carboxymethyluridine(34)-5-O)-methyltransferase alkbh8 n=1 Tax=Lepeophtheirus salmonis TaxID=72036 RepID=UPI001AE5510B|nr:alkylated DNA repair protein alkB homolog 8-like [Lepeophtheirus salmonis]